MHLIRSWGSIMNMLPKGIHLHLQIHSVWLTDQMIDHQVNSRPLFDFAGGKAVWGSVNSAVDGDALDKCAHTPEGDLIKHGAFFTLKRFVASTAWMSCACQESEGFSNVRPERCFKLNRTGLRHERSFDVLI